MRFIKRACVSSEKAAHALRALGARQTLIECEDDLDEINGAVDVERAA
jgi:hypothetical protein